MAKSKKVKKPATITPVKVNVPKDFIQVSNGFNFKKFEKPGDTFQGTYVEDLEFNDNFNKGKKKLCPAFKDAEGEQWILPNNTPIVNAVKENGKVDYFIVFNGKVAPSKKFPKGFNSFTVHVKGGKTKKK